ncbi:MAG: hypothetical protein A2509_00510 [Candidatus Edwardsbacteria bacterium RIFOXYD12_FULL_50_11]|jgi:hypothetical protein|uniref:Inverse autotransporter beta-domain domain-containing protein n=1 Tax=Candidatus Edwardsbacteria bacterium GWF2_54_11 TaxID=1817851 RepID=A0A1F5REH5_9BACT|nr:MAG: hypothetical protein A2502_00740 [Candidatus Edwardsbacteria bacterium RifOxyC12_full_54_24]OGF06194.1 MAG: hypothetical protein A2273_11565 [Candidatus Edwardsbacteria bacterium RifOxyA12_full_54_48]OGF12540.1 MAG: hypothetical protein A3K15_01705 [Candidatus Edwardsbacteria bacterium GWE2_54_12]OGF12855.1 MAG: hypothetical protein A2024_01630 [Candidatus Edwardsbacteria bacterium GWF2_54_11]OGF17621.1 MAG: hypothetical protein A2509_00510 [Candidatus Edwardsbacteria bacterium RIFOXYD1
MKKLVVILVGLFCVNISTASDVRVKGLGGSTIIEDLENDIYDNPALMSGMQYDFAALGFSNSLTSNETFYVLDSICQYYKTSRNSPTIDIKAGLNDRKTTNIAISYTENININDSSRINYGIINLGLAQKAGRFGYGFGYDRSFNVNNNWYGVKAGISNMDSLNNLAFLVNYYKRNYGETYLIELKWRSIRSKNRTLCLKGGLSQPLGHRGNYFRLGVGMAYYLRLLRTRIIFDIYEGIDLDMSEYISLIGDGHLALETYILSPWTVRCGTDGPVLDLGTTVKINEKIKIEYSFETENHTTYKRVDTLYVNNRTESKTQCHYLKAIYAF